MNHQVVKDNNSLCINDASNIEKWQDNPELLNEGLISYLGIPLCWPSGDVFGTLCVLDQKVTNYSEEFVELLWMFKDIVDGELRYINLLNRFEEISETDELTTLLNRRGFIRHATTLCEIANRDKRPLGLFYFDLNGLKSVNDNLGHEMGDKYIGAFANSLSQIKRQTDIAVRVGGDEFCLMTLLPSRQDMDKLAQRLNITFTEQLKTIPQISATASFSVGSHLYNAPFPKLEQMIKETDELMYQNKLKSKSNSHKKE